MKSGQLKQVYILYGEEAYLRNQYKDKLKSALLGGGDPMNLHYYEGKDVRVGEVIDLAETMPFLAERRVIILENSGLFSRGGDELAEYLSAPSETASFVFVEPTVNDKSKLFKAATAKGRAIKFGMPNEADMKKWILGLLKKENKKITEHDYNLFLEKTGSDMTNIRSELEKLFCYCMNRDIITAQDIEEVCTVQVSNRIFRMVDAVAEKRQKKAMELYNDLLALKEEPMHILSLITRQFKLLIEVKELRSKGVDVKAIAKEVGIAEFAARNCVTQAAKFTREDLRTALTDCVESMEAVVTGRMDKVMSVELLIVKYSAAS